MKLGLVEHSSWSCVKLVKKWNKGYEDSSFTVSTSLKNETTPFPNRVFWLRSRKIQVESFQDLESEPSFHPLCWMQWSLGGMYLVLRHYAGGMRTYNKHSFSFQACVNMKPNPSRVLHGSSLCKNEPIPESPLSSFLTRKIWKDCRVFFPFWLAKENKNGGLLSALFWPFKDEKIAELFLSTR
jgi:hypothetical protein